MEGLDKRKEYLLQLERDLYGGVPPESLISSKEIVYAMGPETVERNISLFTKKLNERGGK